MNRLIYIVTEGVHDVAFLGKLLTVVHQAGRVRWLEDLESPYSDWITNSCKWPGLSKKYHDIERLAVPAPVFYRLPSGILVVLRNAQGLTEIVKRLTIDQEAFVRADPQIIPDTIGIVLDSDDAPADQRLREIALKLKDLNLAVPMEIGQIAPGPPRIGIFSLPAPGGKGTLEDLLLSLGDAAYKDLCASARHFAGHWRQQAGAELTGRDWKEIIKPAGEKKAAISAMTAVLKPGKSVQVSIEDNRWINNDTISLPTIAPCLRFLESLLGSPQLPSAPGVSI